MSVNRAGVIKFGDFLNLKLQRQKICVTNVRVAADSNKPLSSLGKGAVFGDYFKLMFL